MTVSWKALSQETVPQWAGLINLLAKADDTDEYYEAEDLAEELTEPGFDPATDSFGAWQDDELIGFGGVSVHVNATRDGLARAHLQGGVHPDHRGHGLGRELMDRLEARAVALAGVRHPGLDVELHCFGGVDGASVRPLLEHRGYELKRYFFGMARDLPGPALPELTGPAVAVLPYSADLDEAVRQAHNETFRSHWGSLPRDVEHWQSYTSSRTFRPEVARLVVEDGVVLAYVLVNQYVEDEVDVALVGTRPAARGRGLARACLRSTLAAIIEHGYRKATLNVDSENGQNAGALYESMGFEVARKTAAYVRTVPAG